MKKYFLFDLDGTVCDTGEGVMKSVQYALDHFGFPQQSEASLRRFIGPPLHVSFQQFFGMSEAQALEAVDKYRERYSAKGVFESPLYPGMGDLLKRFSQKAAEHGAKLCLATSKPLHYARQILELREVDPYFSIIMGASMDGTITEKSDVIREVLRQLGDPPAEQVVMIGDREHDVLGAGSFGVECIGVEFGFAPPGELQAAGAAYVVPTVEALEELLVQLL